MARSSAQNVFTRTISFYMYILRCVKTFFAHMSFNFFLDETTVITALLATYFSSVAKRNIRLLTLLVNCRSIPVFYEIHNKVSAAVSS